MENIGILEMLAKEVVLRFLIVSLFLLSVPIEVNADSLPVNFSNSPYENQYENTILRIKEEQIDYQRSLEEWEREVRKNRIERKRKQREEHLVRQQKQLQEQREHELRLARIHAQERQAERRARRDERRENKERRIRNREGSSGNSTVPENPSLIQRLRYSFTGRYE